MKIPKYSGIACTQLLWQISGVCVCVEQEVLMYTSSKEKSSPIFPNKGESHFLILLLPFSSGAQCNVFENIFYMKNNTSGVLLILAYGFFCGFMYTIYCEKQHVHEVRFILVLDKIL